MADPGLEELRSDLARTDEEIRLAVSRRLAIARAIGEAKRRAGLPVRDFAAEKGVLDRWRNDLSSEEVPPERAEALARWLIEEAVRVQEQGRVERSPPTSHASDVLIVGGAGEMGGWMREFFRASGHRVGIVDPRADRHRAEGYTVHPDLARAAQDADVIVVATPMRVAPSVYRELLKTESEGVIFDILSIKQPILPWVRRGIHSGLHLTSVHPLFGPSARTLSGRNLLVVECGDPRADLRAHHLFGASSLTITHVPIDHHDLLMAETLALPHIVALLFGEVLAASPRAPRELWHAAPTSFLRQLESTQVIASESPELSLDIQHLNPASEALFERLEKALQAMRKAVREGDSATYHRQMDEARAWVERVRPSAGGSAPAHRGTTGDGPGARAS